MKSYYHCCSKGLAREILFKSDEEFIAGINRIAICIVLSLKAGRSVAVLAFCLMDNHFHFILYGTEADCNAYVADYKKLTAMWISKHRGTALMEKIETGCWFVPQYKLGEKIIYVLRNPVAAGLRVTAQGYRWSSAYYMFNDWKPDSFVMASDLSARALNKIFSSRETVPGKWIIVGEMVWPPSFFNVKAAEAPFKSIGSFMFDLNNGNIDKEAEEEMMEGNFSLPDAEVRIRAVQYGISNFRKDSVSKCSADERLTIARLLKAELKCNAKQLARVLRLNPEDLRLLT